MDHHRIRDLPKTRTLSGTELDDIDIITKSLDAPVHTDAGDDGYWGTFNSQGTHQDVAAQTWYQELWRWKDRAKSISYRKLNDTRMLLMEKL